MTSEGTRRLGARKLRLLYALLLAAVLAGPASSQALPRTYRELRGDPGLEDALLRAANGARAETGLEPLSPDERLALAARHHALEMAEMGYFSHTSPLPEHRSLQHRVANAGSALVTLGENLALVPAASAVAEETIGGWLASPGHRQNLLNPLFSHVGHGSATIAGQTYVVQVLAYRPLELVRATTEVVSAETTRFVLDVEAAREATVVFTAGRVAFEPRVVGPGSTTQAIAASDMAPVHVRAGIGLPDGSGYVLDESGWLDPATGTWTPDPSATREVIRVVAANASRSREPLVTVALVFGRAIDRSLAVFANGVHVPDAEVGSDGLRVALPAEAARIDVGEILPDNRVRVLHSLDLDLTPFARVVPAGP